jgi:signal transduction histidine kinase
MAALLAATGIFLLGRIEDELDGTVEADLRVRAGDVAALVTESRRADEPLDVDGSAGRLVQLLDRSNRVVAGSTQLRDRSVLSDAELATARNRELVLRRGPGDGAMLLTRPVAGGQVVVVGTSLQARAEARDALLHALLVAGPAVLVLAILAGYGVAFFALRPVEAMRRRAAQLTGADVSGRLPVPASRDELAALGTTLNAMIDRLEEALERERTLVADASHELRTPLAIAQAELELALRPGAPPEELREALESIGEEIGRLVRLSDDLLVLSRADRSELRLERRPISVAELLERIGERARLAHGDEVRTAPEGAGDAVVDADPLRIEQVLVNLVDNAFRYGASHVRIWCSDGEAVSLHVTDDGPGFPADLLPRAFDRFARGPDVPAGGGAGLGLAIVSAIARAHGGDAGARNLEGGGADVWISLPRA